MNPVLAGLLVSPSTGEPLEYLERGGQAHLVSPSGECFPVTGGIPRFVASEAFTESFGFQWNQFDVRRPQEDEETFRERTGVDLETLGGLHVLDAGCGGGRYSLVAARHGARVVGVDRSRAVEMAHSLAGTQDRTLFVQADLSALPLRPRSFDLVFSIGVLHHAPDPAQALRSIAAAVKPGGRLSIWVYRQNTRPQERINQSLRHAAARLSRDRLLSLCRLAAGLGTIPLLNRTLNKVVPFSNHPSWTHRVCDNFDWYAPTYQYHYRPAQVRGWLEELGFCEVEELHPRGPRLQRWAVRAGLVPGSGINMTARRPG